MMTSHFVRLIDQSDILLAINRLVKCQLMDRPNTDTQRFDLEENDCSRITYPSGNSGILKRQGHQISKKSFHFHEVQSNV